MTRQPRKCATATRALVDRETGQVIGWAYRWDNGDESHATVADLTLGVPVQRDVAKSRTSESAQKPQARAGRRG